MMKVPFESSSRSSAEWLQILEREESVMIRCYDSVLEAAAQALATNDQHRLAVKLIRLNFSSLHSSISFTGISKLFDALQKNSTVDDLIFHHCSDGRAEILASALGNTIHPIRIKNLYLPRCVITSTSATQLARALETNDTLQNLCLSNNPIKDDGARELAKSLESNKALIHLDLAHCGITDIGLECVANMLEINNKLEHLSIENYGITWRGRRKLVNALYCNLNLIDCPGLQLGNEGNQLLSINRFREEHLEYGPQFSLCLLPRVYAKLSLKPAALHWFLKETSHQLIPEILSVENKADGEHESKNVLFAATEEHSSSTPAMASYMASCDASSKSKLSGDFHPPTWYSDETKTKTQKSDTIMKEYSFDEISKHNTPEDCWMIIGNSTNGGPKVYDVSNYLDDHPGGAEVLTDMAGKNADELFDDIGHSNEAREELRRYQIGILKLDAAAKKKMQEEQSNEKKMYLSGVEGTKPPPIMLVLVVLAALAVSYCHQTKQL